LIANGDGLNLGWVDEVWGPSLQTEGYQAWQGIIALPDISNPNRYYLVHSFMDSIPGLPPPVLYCDKTLTTYLDMSANNGNGNVIYKNQPIIADDIGQQITAVRHGNGKDWWILVQKCNTNCFYRVLLTDTGFQVMPDLTCGGQPVGDTDLASVTFSPDGSKFAQFAVFGGLNIYDFDRCTGELSNPIYYPLNTGDSGLYGTGVAISPNNRFLYVSATVVLLQFDLWADDIAASADTVGIYDGYRNPFGSYFVTEQPGPDGKIYIACGNGEFDYHVINNPDSAGVACNFAQHAISLPTPSGGVPNFPNYRLGALTGSACDTISGLDEVARAAKEQILNVFPNPAADYTVIDYGYLDWNKGAASLVITNALGQPVYQQQLPMYSGYQKIDISHFASGMYMAFIKRGAGVVAVAKFVKE
jgi:hypothetical protein